MDITDGALSYELLFDITQGKKNIEEVTQLFMKMGYSAEVAGKMADDFAQSFNSIVKNAPTAESAISKLREKSADLRKEAMKLGDGFEKEKFLGLSKAFSDAADSIEQNKDGFESLKAAADNVGETMSNVGETVTEVGEAAAKTGKAVTVGAKAFKALSTVLKGLGIGLVITALTKLVQLLWQYASGALAAERASQQWSMAMKTLKSDIESMKQYADNMEDFYNATYKSREELRNFRLEQARLREQKAEDNYNAMLKSMEADEKNVSDDDFKKAGELLDKARAERQQVEHQNKLDEIQELKDQKEYDYNALQEQYNFQEAQIALMKDGYAKRAKEIKIGREKERAALQHMLDTADPNTMLDSQRRDIEEQIRLSKEAEAKEIGDLYREQNAEIKRAQEELNEFEYQMSQRRLEQQIKNKQAEIDLMEEGSIKELAQMRHDHEVRLAEIEREAKEEADAMKEANKQKWMNEQTSKGRSVTDADWYASATYKSLKGGLTEEQRRQIAEQQRQDTENENALAIKQNKDFLRQMLLDYDNYTEQKKAIDEQYQQDLNVATLAYLTATEKEKKIYADLIKDIGKGRAKNQFDLDMAKVDTTAYATVEEKMDAINKAYATYIDNLVKAGASVEEINAAMREQNELTGKTATLSAQLKDLEATKLSAAESGDVDLVKRLNEEIRKLKKQLDDIEKTSNKKTLGTMFKEWAHELKASDLINAGGQLGDVIANIGDAAESKAVAGFGQALSFAGDIGAKIASGDYLGAALSIITDIGNAIAEDIAKVKAFEKANEQAAQTANQINIDNLLGGEDGIFGENTVRQLANYLEALDKARKAISDIGVNSSKSFKVLDRSAFANFFGGSDKFSTLGEFARKNGMELLDAYGNINAQVLDLFKNTYEDLTEADKQWIDNAIAYTDQYAEAMEGLASYLETIFGNTVDTIVDQLFEGAVDMKAIVADVGEAMAKDLMKSAIMSSYFGDLKEQMTDILKAEGGMTDRAAAEIYGLYSEAMARFENDLPSWQALAEQYKDAFDFGEASSIGAGTALSSASQESIDLLNGQLNAMRTVQGRIDGTINNILLEMRGFRGDVNANHGETLQQLQQINTNTSERGLGRALGAYFG